MRNLLIFLSLATITAFLAGCGGAGSSGSTGATGSTGSDGGVTAFSDSDLAMTLTGNDNDSNLGSVSGFLQITNMDSQTDLGSENRYYLYEVNSSGTKLTLVEDTADNTTLRITNNANCDDDDLEGSSGDCNTDTQAGTIDPRLLDNTTMDIDVRGYAFIQDDAGRNAVITNYLAVCPGNEAGDGSCATSVTITDRGTHGKQQLYRWMEGGGAGPTLSSIDNSSRGDVFFHEGAWIVIHDNHTAGRNATGGVTALRVSDNMSASQLAAYGGDGYTLYADNGSAGVSRDNVVAARTANVGVVVQRTSNVAYSNGLLWVALHTDNGSTSKAQKGGAVWFGGDRFWNQYIGENQMAGSKGGKTWSDNFTGHVTDNITLFSVVNTNAAGLAGAKTPGNGAREMSAQATTRMRSANKYGWVDNGTITDNVTKSYCTGYCIDPVSMHLAATPNNVYLVIDNATHIKGIVKNLDNDTVVYQAAGFALSSDNITEDNMTVFARQVANSVHTDNGTDYALIFVDNGSSADGEWGFEVLRLWDNGTLVQTHGANTPGGPVYQSGDLDTVGYRSSPTGAGVADWDMIWDDGSSKFWLAVAEANDNATNQNSDNLTRGNSGCGLYGDISCKGDNITVFYSSDGIAWTALVERTIDNVTSINDISLTKSNGSEEIFVGFTAGDNSSMHLYDYSAHAYDIANSWNKDQGKFGLGEKTLSPAAEFVSAGGVTFVRSGFMKIQSDNDSRIMIVTSSVNGPKIDIWYH